MPGRWPSRSLRAGQRCRPAGADGSVSRPAVLASADDVLRQFALLRRTGAFFKVRGGMDRLATALAVAPTRFLLQTRTRFWSQGGLSGYARTDRSAEIWDCGYDLPGTQGILGATVAGAAGRSVLGMSSDAAVGFGRSVVADAFPEIGRHFARAVSTTL